MRIFGVDPGSARTGYGCIETDGSRHRVVVSGALSVSARLTLPAKLQLLHARLSALLAEHRPHAVAVESLFYAKNVRSALTLGHVRGVLLLAASQAALPVAEYSPAEVKRAVVGYGRAEKRQVQEMVTLLLGLSEAPSPLDVSDALAIAVCHAHTRPGTGGSLPGSPSGAARTWRRVRPASLEIDR